MIRALAYNKVISNRSRFGYLHMYINTIFSSHWTVVVEVLGTLCGTFPKSRTSDVLLTCTSLRGRHQSELVLASRAGSCCIASAAVSSTN